MYDDNIVWVHCQYIIVRMIVHSSQEVRLLGSEHSRYTHLYLQWMEIYIYHCMFMYLYLREHQYIFTSQESKIHCIGGQISMVQKFECVLDRC